MTPMAIKCDRPFRAGQDSRVRFPQVMGDSALSIMEIGARGGSSRALQKVGSPIRDEWPQEQDRQCLIWAVLRVPPFVFLDLPYITVLVLPASPPAVSPAHHCHRVRKAVHADQVSLNRHPGIVRRERVAV